jgi:hypothetical protein
LSCLRVSDRSVAGLLVFGWPPARAVVCSTPSRVPSLGIPRLASEAGSNGSQSCSDLSFLRQSDAVAVTRAGAPAVPNLDAHPRAATVSLLGVLDALLELGAEPRPLRVAAVSGDAPDLGPIHVRAPADPGFRHSRRAGLRRAL